MSKKSVYLLILVLVSNAALAFAGDKEEQINSSQWGDPFPVLGEGQADISDTLTLHTALGLVAENNRTLRARSWQLKSAQALVTQAGYLPNPEFEFEAEEASWDLPGFRQVELNFRLSQELELWGKRGARRKVALRDLEKTDWQTRVERFDIYAETKLRFYSLLHAQRKVELSEIALQLAQEVAETARSRVEKGAALLSEQLLGELTLQQSQLDLEQAKVELEGARGALAALWSGSTTDIVAVEADATVEPLPDKATLEKYLPFSRVSAGYKYASRIIGALLDLEIASARPEFTLSGGVKRLEADNIETFLFGLSIPIPLFNRNQGNIGSLRAKSTAISYVRGQALAGARAELYAAYDRLSQLHSTRGTIDSLLLPKAEETYESLKRSYDLGRINYSTLLEGERALINARSALNDLDMDIIREIVTLEKLLGVTLETINHEIKE